jgi:hypothetical protein
MRCESDPEFLARRPSEGEGGIRRVPGERLLDGWPLTILSAPSASLAGLARIGRSRLRTRREDAGRELAPAFATVANRLLWRHRARPSATLDKMRTRLPISKM